MSVSIQKRGKRWTASIRLNGHSLSMTYDLKTQAAEWSGRVRRAIQECHSRGQQFDPAPFQVKPRKLRAGDSILPQAPPALTQADIDADLTPRPDWSLKQAFERYDDTVTDTLKGWRQARSRIKAWQAHPLAQKRFDQVTPDDVAGWIAGRTKPKKHKDQDGNVWIERLPVAASTMRNDLYRLSALYEHAKKAPTKKGWGMTDLTNPAADVDKPKLPEGRQRRLDEDGEDGEESRLFAALATGPDAEEMTAFVSIALETAMRRSEVLSLIASEVRSTRLGRVIERSDSKNGSARRIVLTDRATGAVDRLRAGKSGGDRLFTLDGDAVRYRWNRARRLAGCTSLRLHDVRHEAMSSMADAGLSVGALAAQGGYKTMQTLLRYVNASERDIREKLAQVRR